MVIYSLPVNNENKKNDAWNISSIVVFLQPISSHVIDYDTCVGQQKTENHTGAT